MVNQMCNVLLPNLLSTAAASGVFATLFQTTANSIAPPNEAETLEELPFGRGVAVSGKVVTLKTMVRVENVPNPLAAQKSIEGVWTDFFADFLVNQKVGGLKCRQAV